jgi:hypothetical protein
MSIGLMTGCARALIILLLIVQLACIIFCVLSVVLIIELYRPLPIRYSRGLARDWLWPDRATGEFLVIDSFVE